MKLLIGFVNKFYAPKLNLAILDFQNNKIAWVFNKEMNKRIGPVSGVNGIIEFKDHYFIGYQSNPTKIVVFDKGFNIINVHELPEIKGLHTFAHDGERLFCASTATDEIYALQFDHSFNLNNKEKIFAASANKTDTVHLNSIDFYKGNLIATCFGEKENSSWKNSANGMLFDVTNNVSLMDGLYQPHSAYCSSDNELYFCESGANQFYFSTDEYIDLNGYTRGIVDDDETIFVGLSGRRLQSRSKGTINTGVTNNIDESRSGLTIIEKSTKSIIKHIDLSRYGVELFDMILIQDEPEWISYDDTLLHQLKAYEEQILKLKSTPPKPKKERSILNQLKIKLKTKLKL